MKEMIFYSLTEAELFDPSITERSLRDIRAKGFDSIYLEYRNKNCGFTSPRFMKGYARLVGSARKIGLAVIPDLHFRMNRHEMQERDPEIHTDPIYPHYFRLSDGCFDFSTAREPLHFAIEKAWLIERENDTTLAKAVDITSKISVTSRICEGGGCAMTRKSSNMITTTFFKVRGVDRGEVFLLMRHKYGYANLDLGHKKVRQYVDDLLSRFASPDIRGFMWDEPHFGFAFFPENGRAICERLYGVFRKRFGYDLRDRLIDLWHNVRGRNAALTRFHFAELMEEELAGLEKYFRAATEKRLGKRGQRPIIGMHRTMHEELSDDFYIGCVDYFRHNRHTSDGFTDSVFERDDSMLNMLHLARSLAAASDGKDAYNNSWGFRPREKHHAFYLSLMGAMNVRWIGHTYHASKKFGPGYPDHPLWATLGGHLKTHRAALDFLDGAAPAADTAVLYNWRALATYPDNYLHVHRRDMMLLSKSLTFANVQFQFIGCEILGRAAVSKNGIKTTVGNFRRLIVGWPDMMTPAAFDNLERAASAGLEIVVYGPPPGCTSDGKDAATRFAALAGIKKTTPQEFVKTVPGSVLHYGPKSYSLATRELQPNYLSNPEQTYPQHFRAFDLRPEKSSAIAQAGRRVVGVRKGNLYYFACELPHYKGLVENLPVCGAGLEMPKKLLVFEHRRGREKLLSGVGTWGRPVTGSFEWEGVRVALDGCRLFCLSICDGAARVTGAGARIVR